MILGFLKLSIVMGNIFIDSFIPIGVSMENINTERK